MIDETIDWSTLSESQFFERKSAVSRGGRRSGPRRVHAVVQDILDTLSAMANAEGGELVVGVEDDGLATGVPHSEEHVRLMLGAPMDAKLVSPPLVARARDIFLPEGERLLHFRIQPSKQVHVLVTGRCLVRVRDTNEPLSSRQVPGLRVTAQQRAAERVLPNGASLNDLDFDLASVLPGDEAIENRLANYGLLVNQAGRLVPRLAALLLFGKSPRQWHPACGVEVVRWRVDEDGSVVASRQVIDDPMVVLCNRVFPVVQTLIPKRDRFPLGTVYLYPEVVWQEAVVNAVAHRDYAIRDQRVQIWLFDNRMEVRSPGLPPRPVTANRLNRQRGFHLSRNPLMFRALCDMGVIENLGCGVDRMCELMDRDGLGRPIFGRADGHTLRVTLNSRSVFGEVLQRWVARFDGFDLTDNQKRVLAFAKLHGYRFALGYMQRLTGLDDYRARGVVKEMVRKGVVRAVRRNGDLFQVIEPLNVPSDLVTFLLPILEEKDWITNRDVREALGVRRHAARRLLKRWVTEGWLVKAGEGSKTIYLPGWRTKRSV